MSNNLNVLEQGTATALSEQFKTVRAHSERLCAPLQTEDYVVQPVDFVSPPKWHLGHTSWFFETMVLLQFAPGYQAFDPNYNFVFNSYYESIGARVIRTDRGNLSRPSVQEVYRYRRHIDLAMQAFLEGPLPDDARRLVILGLQHEQQHQELLCTDIKYILGNNPLFPAYSEKDIESVAVPATHWISVSEGLYTIGHQGTGFCFDNECGAHKVYLNDFSVSSALVSNGDYIRFIAAGGYDDFRHWHAEGWEWKKDTQAQAPLYWHRIDGAWHHYTLSGLQKVDEQQPVTHINYFEAHAYASWLGVRLPTEAEWEVACGQFEWGSRWEWTRSAYLPYPGFTMAADASGEYNGKFMVNQMVLRGASVATPEGHGRSTYRNFFHPQLQWQFTGIRLAK